MVDRVAEQHGCRFRAAGSDDVWLAELELPGGPVLLAKPQTFMNLVGPATAELCRRQRTPPEELLAVYDDADLAFGRVRIRPEGGAGGHNGVRSLIASLGTQAFPRLRLGVRGVGREAEELADYVLRPFDPEERDGVEELVRLGAEAVEAVLGVGLAEAMNRYNGPLASDGGGC